MAADKKAFRLQIHVLSANDATAVQGVAVEVLAVRDDREHTATLALLASDRQGFCATDVEVFRSWDSLQVRCVHQQSVTNSIKADFIDTLDEVLVLRLLVPPELGTTHASLASVIGGNWIDWDRSPWSFVQKTDMKFGDGAGCDVPVPRNLTSTEIRFVRLLHHATMDSDQLPVETAMSQQRTSVLAQLGRAVETAARRVLVRGPADASRPQLVDVLEVKQSWTPLGHALGDLVYSVPLAPCESVNIAVLEATRSDVLTRSDALLGQESLLQ
jgi:hypothetical protein